MDMSFELIIFDLDGTLVDSLDALADSMNAVLESFGFPTPPTAPYGRFVGDGVTWGFRDKDELCSSGAQHVIHHPLELLAILKAAG